MTEPLSVAPESLPITAERAHAELAEITAWWERFNNLQRQAPMLQQRVAFLEGWLSARQSIDDENAATQADAEVRTKKARSS